MGVIRLKFFRNNSIIRYGIKIIYKIFFFLRRSLIIVFIIILLNVVPATASAKNFSSQPIIVASFTPEDVIVHEIIKEAELKKKPFELEIKKVDIKKDGDKITLKDEKIDPIIVRKKYLEKVILGLSRRRDGTRYEFED